MYFGYSLKSFIYFGKWVIVKKKNTGNTTWRKSEAVNNKPQSGACNVWKYYIEITTGYKIIYKEEEPSNRSTILYK